MNRNEFYAKLKESDLEVVFEKKTDGSIRTMKCTANAPESDKSEHQRATRPETLITVYDTEAKGWRCFYSDSIKEVKPLDTNFGLLQE
jgi:hypothetical protein